MANCVTINKMLKYRTTLFLIFLYACENCKKNVFISQIKAAYAVLFKGSLG